MQRMGELDVEVINFVVSNLPHESLPEVLRLMVGVLVVVARLAKLDYLRVFISARLAAIRRFSHDDDGTTAVTVIHYTRQLQTGTLPSESWFPAQPRCGNPRDRSMIGMGFLVLFKLVQFLLPLLEANQAQNEAARLARNSSSTSCQTLSASLRCGVILHLLLPHNLLLPE